jgi:hypothetical protein
MRLWGLERKPEMLNAFVGPRLTFDQMVDA